MIHFTLTSRKKIFTSAIALFSTVLSLNASSSVAMDIDDGPYTSVVTDVTHEYFAAGALPSIIPTPTPGIGGGPTPDGDLPPEDPTDFPTGGNGRVGRVIGSIVSIGTRVWDFVVSNKPGMTYKTIEGAVWPEGVKSWTQLTGWENKSRPLTRIFRVEFKNIFGRTGGSFEYRISYIYGGGYKGVGKFLGKISLLPMNTKLKTDRSLNVRAELLDPFNAGTEADPIAATSIRVHWDTPTTTRYQQDSAEYMIYGNGEFFDFSQAE